MTSVSGNLQQVHERIAAACSQAGRAVHSVTLLAVSKTFPAAAVRQAFDAGQRDFGENQLQEALDKMAQLAELRPAMRWHLIGPLQSNKTRAVAESFDWVHSVDRLKIAQRLSDQRPANLAPLQICLQVNISGEASKSGVSPFDVLSLAQAVAGLPRLQLRGLMSIPAPASGQAEQRAPHRRLRELLQSLQAQGLQSHGLPLDTLSMGMSDDLEAAVAEGATLLRVGRALFGTRGQDLDPSLTKE